MVSLVKNALTSAILLCFCVSTTSVSSAEKEYPDSADGLRAQVLDIIHTANVATAQGSLESLAIPDADKWFVSHLDQRFAKELPADYKIALSKFQSHISWVAANFSKFEDFGLTVEALDNPTSLSDIGFESLLPRPLDGVKIENFRFTSTSSDPKHGPPHWVSGFVYVDGLFRWIGGTYPFWDEGLDRPSRTYVDAPTVVQGKTVQGIAYRKDQKGPGIDAVVQFKISIGGDGRVDHLKVLSGEEPFVQYAKDYLKAANFGALPNIPQLANAKREWEFEVAFFTPKQ